uniref:Uncharacterized protein n=1 Tax=Rhizophora mucronata TaxID=61149 RepID=A0A2P2IMN1_RHIMU
MPIHRLVFKRSLPMYYSWIDKGNEIGPIIMNMFCSEFLVQDRHVSEYFGDYRHLTLNVLDYKSKRS